MTETIDIEVPRRGIGSDLTEALGAHGLTAEIVETDDTYSLRVSFTDNERERLIVESTHAIETYLAERMLPLVVVRGNGDCIIVRPLAD
jgi:hypothetical protein